MRSRNCLAIMSLATERSVVSSERGKVADDIPELACIDPVQFGLSICLCNGTPLNFVVDVPWLLNCAACCYPVGQVDL